MRVSMCGNVGAGPHQAQSDAVQHQYRPMPPPRQQQTQKGFTITKITMPISNTVGISLMMRK